MNISNREELVAKMRRDPASLKVGEIWQAADFIEQSISPDVGEGGTQEWRARKLFTEERRELWRAASAGEREPTTDEETNELAAIRAIERAISTLPAPDHGVRGLPPFAEAWAKKEAAGYRYGGDALENVAFGYAIAEAELASLNKDTPS